MASNSTQVSPWQQRPEDGSWSRPLKGPEVMYDKWLELDSWTEWMAAMSFSVSPSNAYDPSNKAGIESWFKRAVTRLCIEKPSLLAFIERGEDGSTANKSRTFVYRPLISDYDLSDRISQRITILHTEVSIAEGIKSLTDEFYSNPDKRISIELGEHLIHFSLIVSSKIPGTFALVLRCNHALNDFWSGMGIFDDLLGKLADGLGSEEASFPSYKDVSTSRLHPNYLDLLQRPLGFSTFDSEAEQRAQALVQSNLENITMFPVIHEPAGASPDTDYSVRRRVFSEEVTAKIIQASKDHGVTVTAFLTALQAFALINKFPPVDASRSSAAPILVSNRLRHTTLGGQDSDVSSANHLRRVVKGAAAVGPVMSTNFLVSPFDVSAYLKPEAAPGTAAWKSSVWQVAENVHKTITETVASDIGEYLGWTEGSTGFGAVAQGIEAMKAGLIPKPPGIMTPLSSAGLLDGIHVQRAYNSKNGSATPAIKLDDFTFYPRVSTLFGAQTWVWTALGKLNNILVMPDPRVSSTGSLEWWDLYNDMIIDIVTNPS